MLLYKWRYALFASFMIAEVMTWLCMSLPAGIFFDAVPNFVFTTFLALYFGGPILFILYWSGLARNYRRNAFGKADALAFAISMVVFLLKAVVLTLQFIEIYWE